jgi:Relaxase/Mobilisation nuclease domain
MIVKIGAAGKSFSGLATYLTHDPEAAKTQDRLDWTHTLNLAEDHVPSAVNEMLWTARHAELLKQEAGVRGGGRATESPVKHVSLSWSPEEKPTRERMIETAEDFLHHMKWHEHQVVLIAHSDKPYAHVHLVLNMVHPDTGLRLDDDFERRRAQKWALRYEWENGRIYCEERLKLPEEREPSPTRPAWTAFEKKQQEFERAEKGLENQAPILIGDGNNPNFDINSEEWKILKENQKADRKEFFAEGKNAFSDLRKSIYREVREEFRERWSDYYAAIRHGGDGDTIALMKAELLADQKATLEARRDEACKALRESRDGLYKQLLLDQQTARHDLHERQDAGLDSTVFLELERDGRSGARDITADFRQVAAEVTSARHDADEASSPDTPAFGGRPGREYPGMKSGADIGANLAGGIGFGVISLLESVADGIMGAKPAPKPRRAAPERADPFDAVMEEGKRRREREQEEGDSEWRKRQERSYGE